VWVRRVNTFRGMENFRSLLGMPSAAKYETTWEGIAKAVRDHVTVANRALVFGQIASLLLSTCALRNADWHAENVALNYIMRRDVQSAPAHDMLATAAYPDYAKNPPGIAFMGRKTRDRGKSLQTFITVALDLPAPEQAAIADQGETTMAEVDPQVHAAMVEHPVSAEIGKRKLLTWQEDITGLREERTYSLGGSHCVKRSQGSRIQRGSDAARCCRSFGTAGEALIRFVWFAENDMRHASGA